MSERDLAVVTGGASGIGAEICRHMLAAGYEVDLARPAQGRTGSMSACRAIEVDLLDDAATRDAANRVAQRLAVTHVVHNAGAIRPACCPRSRREDLHALTQLHLGAALHLVQAALPGMKSRRVRPHHHDLVARQRWACRRARPIRRPRPA